MSTYETLIQHYEFNRGRTLALLDAIDETGQSAEVLGWRPGAGRAHIAWQIMHIGITEEIFATERLAPDKPQEFSDLWSRFRGGSTPDDDIPSSEEIRNVLKVGREHLLDTLGRYGEENLGDIPPPLAARSLTMLKVLHIISWHESHHHGQAHITFNLFKNQ